MDKAIENMVDAWADIRANIAKMVKECGGGLKYAIHTDGKYNLLLCWEKDSDVYEWLKTKIEELENNEKISRHYIRGVKHDSSKQRRRRKDKASRRRCREKRSSIHT